MITLIVLATGLAIAVGAYLRSNATGKDVPVIDPDTDKRAVVDALASRPRLAAFVARRLDRSSAGGFLLTFGFLFVFGSALLVAWIFDLLEESRGFAEFDDTVAEFGAASATELSTGILSVVTELGGTLVVTALAIGVGLYGWLRRKNISAVWFMLTVVIGQAAVNNGLKLLTDRDRPDVDQLVGWAGSSFPSGHTAAAAATWAAAALVLGLGRSPRVRAALYSGAVFIAVVVAATRALLGVHWLTDVVAGLAVGWAWFVVSAVVFGGRFMVFGEPKDEVAIAVGRNLDSEEAYTNV